MKKLRLRENPYLLFFPFLIAFIVYVLILPTDGTGGDQPRYLYYANNLIHGFYSTPAPNIQLINGPGYPIVLIPFLILKLPLLSITIANAFFYYFSIIFLFKALIEIVSYRVAITFSFAWASYYIAYQNIPFIHTETFTYLLISILIYFIIKAFKQGDSGISKKYVILAGFIFGCVVLTKMIFGYVLMFMLVGSFLFWILNRNNQNFRKGLMISAIAFIVTVPYLLYTYNLTGRIFYWGFGSDSLYCMTTPYEGEYGDFKLGLGRNPVEAGNYNIPGADSVMRVHHKEDFEEINKYTGIEKDDAYKRLAIRNIKAHPMKFAQNIVYNIGRLIFHYPFSQAIERPKTLMIFPINGILLTLMLFSLIPTFLNWRKIPMPVKYMLMITFLYLGASSLVTAYVRMFTIVVPIILFWIAYIVQFTIKVNLKFSDET